MTNKLDAIVQQKQHEVAALQQIIALQHQHPVAHILRGTRELSPVPSFKKALAKPTLAVIAEIKRKSPSKGELALITDPISLARAYTDGGASALSILTDQRFFSGHLDDLTQVATALSNRSMPLLRKDFIIDKIQIAEAAAAGASAILCIVALLGKETQAMIDYAHSLNLDALVEIHDSEELQIALDCGADIIGINNRNLKTFTVDINTALQLLAAIPKNIITVAESGISTPRLAQCYYQAGFNAVLIGEALVTSADPASFIRDCCHA